MTEPLSLRRAGWTGPIWIIEQLIADESGESVWYFHGAWTHNPAAEYRGHPRYRVRRGTLTMEE